MDTNTSYKKHNIIKYLPSNENNMQWGTTISGIGYQHIDAKCKYPIKGHPIGYTFNPDRGRTLDEYAIVYITKGQGTFTSVNTGEKELLQGDVFFIYPGHWHSYRPSQETGWDEYWITFRGMYFEILLNSLTNKNHPIFHIGINEQIVKLFQEMLDCAQAQQIGFQQVLSGITLHILGLMYSISKNQIFEAKDIQKIQEACVIMRESVYNSTGFLVSHTHQEPLLYNKLTPEDIACTLNMGYSSFRKLFKQYTGLAPHQYMLQIKLEKIKDLLGNTDLSIQDIASGLNFESADYFSFFFRSKTGISPLMYRKNIEKQRTEAKQKISPDDTD